MVNSKQENKEDGEKNVEMIYEDWMFLVSHVSVSFKNDNIDLPYFMSTSGQNVVDVGSG